MDKIVITCEHATNKIPAKYNKLFKNNKLLLNSHHGYDIGAHTVAKKIKKHANFYQISRYSRLLIDLNRSENHPHIFSDIINTLSNDEKMQIMKKYYLPYRYVVEEIIDNFLHKKKKTLHLSVHTFTSKLINKPTRNCDIGILYDPKRSDEKILAYKWKQFLLARDPKLKIRFNYPYLGIADGLITYLRKRFKNNYVGFELEVNQKFFTTKTNATKISKIIANSFSELLQISKNN